MRGQLADHTVASPYLPLINKLRYGADLKGADWHPLAKLVGGRRIGARQQIVLQGDRTENVYVVLDGFACRYKILSRENARLWLCLFRVTSVICTARSSMRWITDHVVISLYCPAEFPRATILRLFEDNPRVGDAFLWAALVDGAIQREWLVNTACAKRRNGWRISLRASRPTASYECG